MKNETQGNIATTLLFTSFYLLAAAAGWGSFGWAGWPGVLGFSGVAVLATAVVLGVDSAEESPNEEDS